MKVEVDFTKGKNSAGMFVHKALGQSMGNSVAAFVHAVLSGDTEPGVWYPEVRAPCPRATSGGRARRMGWDRPACMPCPVLSWP